MIYRAQIEGLPSEEILRRLLADARERGADEIVVETSREAGEGWVRAGFNEVSRVLTAPVSALELHLGGERRSSFGSIHIQTDDAVAVATAVRQFVPRLPGGSAGSVVVPPRDGWTSVYDELCDREPEMLRRLAVELSNRSAALVLTLGVEEGQVARYVALDRGRVVDEYLSVPEFYGPLPPGEVIALGANPRLMARLTGAHPEAIRHTAVTAPSAAGLPPARELIANLGRLFGIQGAEQGYDDARGVSGAIDLPRSPASTS
jgi:hypothetical protein